jgi:hypothetical protein
MSDDQERDASLSRRAALVRSTTGLGVLACAFSGCVTNKVQGRMAQAEAQYQEHPSGLERCGTCKHFIPVTGCEIVAAPVQANGWCKYYKLF